jgi:hypothetical protein
MRPKIFRKKLVLNKETICNLNHEQMQKNRGGAVPTQPPLASCNLYDKTRCDLCTDPDPILVTSLMIC